MKEEIISIETAKKLGEAEKNKKIIEDALKYINEECVYDKHLQGYVYGLKPGQVRTLVLKLGGRNDSKRDV